MRPTQSTRSERTFDTRVLWRLAIWGFSALVGVSVAVIAANSDVGHRRMTAAPPAKGGNDAPSPAIVQLATRSAEIGAETRRLAESVRVLTNDRERLAARVVALERSLEDVTGAIKRQTASPPATPAAPPALPPVLSPPSSAAVPPQPPVAAARPVTAAVAVNPPTKPAEPAVELQRPPQPKAATPQTSTAVHNDRDEAPRVGFGIDIGGGINFDGLRVLWVSTKNSNTALVDGLHPVVMARENPRTKSPELRLIVGPIESAEAASRLCAKLVMARRYCHPVPFEGQRLAHAETLPERKPTPKPTPTPKPAPAPAEQQPSFGWPFR